MGPEHLLRPWIMKVIIEAPNCNSPNAPAESYLGITSRRHERGGVTEGDKMYFSDGEVTMLADFSEANALVSCSLPNSYDPASSHCPPALAIVRLISFRTVFEELPGAITVNGQQVHYTVTFKVEEFCILQPNWSMPGHAMPLCCYCPGIQKKAAAFFNSSSTNMKNSRSSIASTVASPGASITSTIIRAVAAASTGSNSQLLPPTQSSPSNSLSSLKSPEQALHCEVGSAEYSRRRRKLRPTLARTAEADCQTIETGVDDSSIVGVTSQTNQESTNNQDQSIFVPSTLSQTNPVLSLPNSSPIPVVRNVEIPLSLPNLIAPLVGKKKDDEFFVPSTPVLEPGLVRSRSSYERQNNSPTVRSSPRINRSLVSSFTAGRKGRRSVSSSEKPTTKATNETTAPSSSSSPRKYQSKPCLVALGPRCDAMLSGDILERAGINLNSAKPVKTSQYFPIVSYESNPSSDEDLQNIPTSSDQLRRKIPVRREFSSSNNDNGNRPTAPVVLAKPNQRPHAVIPPSQKHGINSFPQSSMAKSPSRNVIVPPMTTCSQLGLVEPGAPVAPGPSIDSGTTSSSSLLRLSDSTNPNSDSTHNNPNASMWWDRLGHLSKSMFQVFWGAFGRTDNNNSNNDPRK